MRYCSVLLLVLLLNLPALLMAQSSKKMTRAEYIEAFKDIAIKEMERSGVPASITLAQGMLESDNGNSRLAIKANNHFGIKCHNDWKGKKIYHDDDQAEECFRRYNSVFESYDDHSEFLKNGSRYSFLFELDPLDYTAWAKGLKKAGYATNPEYAEKLITIIDENELHQFDLKAAGRIKSGYSNKNYRNTSSVLKEPTRKILKRNRIDYIIIQEGDTYESLQKELGLLPFEIFKYNDLNRDSLLYAGRELYVQPKRQRAEPGKFFHVLRQGETMFSISQMYGVKLERLYKMNLMNPGIEPVPGQKISLRKKLKAVAENSSKDLPVKIVPESGKEKEAEKRSLKKNIKPAEETEDEIQFEFK